MSRDCVLYFLSQSCPFCVLCGKHSASKWKFQLSVAVRESAGDANHLQTWQQWESERLLCSLEAPSGSTYSWPTHSLQLLVWGYQFQPRVIGLEMFPFVRNLISVTSLLISVTSLLRVFSEYLCHCVFVGKGQVWTCQKFLGSLFGCVLWIYLCVQFLLFKMNFLFVCIALSSSKKNYSYLFDYKVAYRAHPVRAAKCLGFF